ncbi:hypothetical protein [Caulobacter sp. X]|uniref:hypothetical protein n=1 Tax=Caulobacter sp. X TaxID=2048901 RepID=UPI000C1544E7|nr:hypothetical protein [Caulobacter sp. X]PIB96492.1 hypothetical protein CSW60_18465 [Caulobacter sp. X]
MTEITHALTFSVEPEPMTFPGNVLITVPCKVLGSLEIQGDLTLSGALIVHGLAQHDEDGALTVMDPVTRETGRVTGLTSELRPIVTWASGQVRSRNWSDLVLGDGRAW